MSDNFEIENNLGISGYSSRSENIRESQLELKRIKKNSDKNIQIIRNNSSSGNEEVNRNTIVNLIACLDYYTREIVLWGIIAITQDKFKKGKKFDDFDISIKFLKDAFDREKVQEINKEDLREEVIKKLKSTKYTFQKWKKIRDGLKIILPSEFDKKVSQLVTNKNETGSAIFQVNDLQELNDIRNNIVHHFDRDYSDKSRRTQHDRYIEKDILLIETMINSIHKIIEEYEEEASRQ